MSVFIVGRVWVCQEHAQHWVLLRTNETQLNSGSRGPVGLWQSERSPRLEVKNLS